MRNILVTNDDGITSDGIVRLARAAKRYGRVWVIAPLSQCSAMSHRITLREPIKVYPADFPVSDVTAYATTGTPADCVRFGKLNIIKGTTDLVLSGINVGYNCGSDIQYSATAGAALEGASSGSHAIAVSEDVSDCHDVTDRYLQELLDEYTEAPLEYGQIWNINFPGCSLSECRGVLRDRSVAHNSFFTDQYSEEALPGGGIKLMVNGVLHENAAEDTDFRAIVDRYVSVGRVSNLR